MLGTGFYIQRYVYQVLLCFIQWHWCKNVYSLQLLSSNIIMCSTKAPTGDNVEFSTFLNLLTKKWKLILLLFVKSLLLHINIHVYLAWIVQTYFYKHDNLFSIDSIHFKFGTPWYQGQWLEMKNTGCYMLHTNVILIKQHEKSVSINKQQHEWNIKLYVYSFSSQFIVRCDNMSIQTRCNQFTQFVHFVLIGTWVVKHDYWTVLYEIQCVYVKTCSTNFTNYLH